MQCIQHIFLLITQPKVTEYKKYANKLNWIKNVRKFISANTLINVEIFLENNRYANQAELKETSSHIKSYT